MKKIFVLILLIVLNISVVFAENKDKDYTVNFNGNKFHLLYSVKNKDFGGYLNEYYKKGETYNIWSEMVAVHHFPNAYSPIDRISDFKDYLSSMHVPSALTFDEKKNTAMIDFIMISDKSMPVILEFNIFKYEKSKKCGSIAIQYARRYSATTTMQIEAIKKDIEKNRKILCKKIKKFEIPTLVTKDIDKCISASDIIEQNKQETLAEEKKKEELNIAKEKEEQAAESVAADNVVVDENNTEEETINKDDAASYEVEQTQAEVSENNEKLEVIHDEPIALQTKEKSSEITEITDKTESEILKTEAKTEQNIIEEKAPVPVKIQENKKYDKKQKSKIKNVSYDLTNDKNEYIAVPRTKKELKAEVKDKKQKQKEAAKQAKRQAKIDKELNKLQLKTDKINKKIEKYNKKQAEKIFVITNDNSNLIAKPRTKKEIKANNKKMRQKAKQRAKEAKKRLD